MTDDHHDDCPSCTCDFEPPEWWDYIATATQNDDGVPAYEHCLAVLNGPDYGYDATVALQTAIAVNENFSRARCKYKKPWKVFLAWYVKAVNQPKSNGHYSSPSKARRY